MKMSIFFMAAALFLCSCNKMAEAIIDQSTSNHQGKFKEYIIKKGAHYCEGNQLKLVDDDEFGFSVIFDSSAIYSTAIPGNQYDINKLFGFADNNSDHHQFSARFGWRWSDNALRLFAYVYNQGMVSSKEIGEVIIGKEVSCAIRITEGQYVFIMDEHKIEMPRMAATPQAKGYQLYPYFGGDETAPHEIKIRIKEMN